jgi:hypothetical protein
MLSAKTKGIFVQTSRYRSMILVASQEAGAPKVERIEEVNPVTSPPRTKELIAEIGAGANVKFVPCACSVYPEDRFFHRHNVDTPIKLKDAGYFEEVLKSQAGVDVDANSVSVLLAGDGNSFDPSRNLALQKELLFAGALTTSLRACQEQLLGMGVYPERMELGTLSTIGSLIDVARLSTVRKPTLLIEIGYKATHLFITSLDRLEVVRTLAFGMDSILSVLSAELGVKDEQSASNMLLSNTFDFADMGPVLLSRILREVRALTGFHEVQTGQSVGNVMVDLLPGSLEWVGQCIAKTMGAELLKVDYAAWMGSHGFSIADAVKAQAVGPQWISLFGMVPDFTTAPVEKEAGK